MAGLSSSSVAPVRAENPFKPSWMSRVGVLAVIAYLFYSFITLDLTLDRLIIGFGESERILGRMFPPHFSRSSLLLSGLPESL